MAHGASRGFSHAPSPLAPLPARRGEGCQGSSASRWRGVGPGFPGLAPWANRDFSPRSGKGGASAPPQQDIPSYPRVSRPEQLVRSSGSGRETKRELAAASSAGLKPRPSDRPMKATKCGEKSGLISYAPAGLIGQGWRRAFAPRAERCHAGFIPRRKGTGLSVPQTNTPSPLFPLPRERVSTFTKNPSRESTPSPSSHFDLVSCGQRPCSWRGGADRLQVGAEPPHRHNKEALN